jgi:2-phosphosulfolactate phosphatase
MVDMYPIPAGIPDNIEKDRPIVIIDIFRASTSITAALGAGAREIFVAGSRREAMEIKARIGDEAILAGERKGFKIEGYDLGNSPHEMSFNILRDRPVIFNSTNGTKLMRRFTDYTNVVVGSIVSLSATVDYLKMFANDPVFCCAATEGRFSNEDTICAGMIIERLEKPDTDLDDAAFFATHMVSNIGNKWYDWSKNSKHGRYLASIGLGEDLDFCLELDRYDFVPVKKGDRIIRGGVD